MKPLVYLTVRSTVNGVRRALTSAKRLISLIFVVGYYVMVFIRPFSGPPRAFSRLSGGPHLVMPPLEVIDAVVFALFGGISIFLMLGVFGYKGAFRPADVDVLFPTPVSPKIVLIFRIVRDYLITLLLPLVFIVLGYRPAAAGIGYLFSNVKNPETIGYVTKAMSVAWLLVAMCWVCISYAASLFVNRSDLTSDRNRKLMTVGLLLLVGAIGVYIALAIRQMTKWEDAVVFLHAPALRVIFFTATAATAMVMGPLQGEMALTALGAAGLLGIITVSLQIAMTQVGWMYDQAAARGFDALTLRSLQRKGDTYGMLAEQARMGKLKAGRSRWIQRLNVPGPRALIWKEVIIQYRSALMMTLLFLPIVLFMTLMPLLAFDESSGKGAGAAFLGMQAFGVFITSMAFSQTGFIELLRRVDLQKPLPFPSSTTVLMEVIAKAIPAVLVSSVATIVAVIFRPAIWQEGIGALLLMPFVATLICATVLLVTILFPDFDDPTQRGFRGLITLLAMVIAGSPGLLAFIALYALGSSAILSALVACAVNVGITAGIATLAGSQYAAYNPSE